ncbi:MAG: AAA family ATPase [Blautia sp.]|nr:AAA family ATPase [Blautia sp.]
MKITKIVITGGPCAGKTTALSWIQNEFLKKGYMVLFVAETATQLISGGVAPWTCGSNLEYQRCQVALQKKKEEIFEQAARSMNAEKVLIVCDRGVIDNKVYMTQKEFRMILDELNTNEVEERDRYDAVFHLVTAAKGAEEAYTLSNNIARTESVEQAIALDDKLIAGWTGHPHLRVIDNSTSFQRKLERLLEEITSFLGEPVPFEIERKYLIRYPDLKALEALENCTKVEIEQAYLNSAPGQEIRIRKRGAEGNYIYYRTEKKRISAHKRVETEERLTRQEYLKSMLDMDPKTHPIRKTRYCLMENNQYFEIDIYPEWEKQAIMEIELNDVSTPIHFPEMIEVIREVTEDYSYSNHQMAHAMPEE